MSSQWTTPGLDLHLEIAGQGRRASLENALRRAIGEGRLAPGAVLASTRALSAELGVSRGTVTAAYEQLIAEGYLRGRRGSGTAVADGLRPPPPPAAERGAAEAAPRHDLHPGSPDLAAFPVAAWLRATAACSPHCRCGRSVAAIRAAALSCGRPWPTTWLAPAASTLIPSGC